MPTQDRSEFGYKKLSILAMQIFPVPFGTGLMLRSSFLSSFYKLSWSVFAIPSLFLSPCCFPRCFGVISDYTNFRQNRKLFLGLSVLRSFSFLIRCSLFLIGYSPCPRGQPQLPLLSLKNPCHFALDGIATY